MINIETYNYNRQKKITKIIFGIFMLAVILYVFFIGIMSVSAARMDDVESQERELRSNISELEYEYLSLGKNITISYARSLGFSEPKKVIFVTEKILAIK